MRRLTLTNGNKIEFDCGVAIYKFSVLKDGVKKSNIRLTPLSFYLILMIINHDNNKNFRVSLINALQIDKVRLERGIIKAKRIFEIDESVKIVEEVSEKALLELCKEIKNYDSAIYTPTRLKGPRSLVFRITNQCSQNCIYCYADSSREIYTPFTIPLDVLDERLQEASMLGCKDIVFTGGEPLLCNELPELIKLAKKYNLETSTSTKTKIKKDKLQELVEAGLDKLQVSLDTLNEELASKMTGSKTAVKDALATMDNALKANLDLTVACVVTRLNINTIPELIFHLISIGVKNIILKEYKDTLGRGSDTLSPGREEILNLKKILDTITCVNIQKFFHSDSSVDFMTSRERSYCESLRSTLTFIENGEVYLCDLMIEEDCYIGNLVQNTIAEIWNSNRAMSFVEPKKEQFAGSECENCRYFDLCLPKRCYMRSKLKYGKVFSVDPHCNVMLKDIV